MPSFIVGADPVANPPRIDRKRDGRWCLYSGAPVVTTIEGMNDGKPIQLVIDLETARFRSGRVHALSEHDDRRQVGHWDNLEINDTGIYGDLFLVNPETPEETAYFTEVLKYRALMRNESPIQVSVGSGGQFEPQKASFTCNGRKHSMLDSVPSFILRNADIHEASLCTFGADDQTGRVAASRKAALSPSPSNKDTTMDLKVLLSKYDDKHHGMIARLVAQEKTESDIASEVAKADKAEVDAVLAAKDEQIAELTKQVETLTASASTTDAETAKLTSEIETLKARLSRAGAPTAPAHTEQKISSGDTVAPKTMSEAMAQLRAKDSSLKGFALRRAARQAFPEVQDL